LSYSGGVLGTGAIAYWYDNAGFTGPEIAQGNVQTISAPISTTTYYVRFEGDCNITGAVSVTVTVYPMPAPVISGELSVCEPELSVYTVSGTAGSSYQWSVTGGLISGSSTGSTVTIEWSGIGTGTLEVEETTSSGCSASDSINVLKLETPDTGDIVSGTSLTRR